MTLCLAWTQNDKIHLASDSRGGDEENYLDTLIKVVDIRVIIETPVEQDDTTEIAYDHTLGLCFSGSTLNSVIVKDHITETLRHLQFLPGITELSLHNICKTIGKYFRLVSANFKKGYGWDPETVFLIGGYCPLLKKVSLYRLELFPTDDEQDYELVIDRMMEDPEEICYLGSGQDHARELIEAEDLSGSSAILGVLREICLDENHPDVGGYIQFGLFEGDDFVLRGIQDYIIDEYDEIKFLHVYRGIVLHDGDFAIDENEFQIRMKYLSPFKKDTDAYFERKAAEE